MVDLRLRALDEAALSGEIFVAVRIGDVQKLGRIAPERQFKFTQPNVRNFRYGKMEIFQRIGSCNIGVDPSQEGEQALSVPINGDGSQCYRFKVELGRLEEHTIGKKSRPETAKPVSDNSKLLDPIPEEKVVQKPLSKTRVAGARYLDKHNFELRLAQAVQDMMRVEPEDPATFIGEALKRSQGVVTRLASKVIEEEKPATPLEANKAVEKLTPLASPAMPDATKPLQESNSSMSKNHKEKPKMKVPAVLPPLSERPPSATNLKRPLLEETLEISKQIAPPLEPSMEEKAQAEKVCHVPAKGLSEEVVLREELPQVPQRAPLLTMPPEAWENIYRRFISTPETQAEKAQDLPAAPQCTPLLAMPAEAWENIYRWFAVAPAQSSKKELPVTQPEEVLETRTTCQVEAKDLPQARVQTSLMTMPSGAWENIYRLFADAPDKASKEEVPIALPPREVARAQPTLEVEAKDVPKAPTRAPLLAIPPEAWDNIHRLFASAPEHAYKEKVPVALPEDKMAVVHLASQVEVQEMPKAAMQTQFLAIPPESWETIYRLFAAAPEQASKEAVPAKLPPREVSEAQPTLEIEAKELQKSLIQAPMLAIPTEAWENIYGLFAAAPAKVPTPSPPTDLPPILEVDAMDLPKTPTRAPLLAIPPDAWQNIYRLFASVPKQAFEEEAAETLPPEKIVRDHAMSQVEVQEMPKALTRAPSLAIPPEAWEKIYRLFVVAPEQASREEVPAPLPAREASEAQPTLEVEAKELPKSPPQSPFLAIPPESWEKIYRLFAAAPEQAHREEVPVPLPLRELQEPQPTLEVEAKEPANAPPRPSLLAIPPEDWEKVYRRFSVPLVAPREVPESQPELEVEAKGLPKAPTWAPLLEIPPEAWENIYRSFACAREQSSKEEVPVPVPVRGASEAQPTLEVEVKESPKAPNQAPLLAIPSEETAITLLREEPEAQLTSEVEAQKLPSDLEQARLLEIPPEAWRNIYRLFAIAPVQSRAEDVIATSPQESPDAQLALPAEEQKVVTTVEFSFKNLDYDKVTESPELAQSLKSQVHGSIVSSLRVPSDCVQIEISRGSVVVNASVSCLNGDGAEALRKQIDATGDSLLQAVSENVAQIPAIKEAVIDPSAGLGASGLKTQLKQCKQQEPRSEVSKLDKLKADCEDPIVARTSPTRVRPSEALWSVVPTIEEAENSNSQGGSARDLGIAELDAACQTTAILVEDKPAAKSAVEEKSAEEEKLAEEAAPCEEKPAEQAAPLEEKPAEEAALAGEAAPAEQAPAAEVLPPPSVEPRPTITGEAAAKSAPPSGEPAVEASSAEEKLAAEAVSVEEKPAEGASPSEDKPSAKSAVEDKPAEEEKPAEEAVPCEEKPAEQAAPLEEKPAEVAALLLPLPAEEAPAAEELAPRPAEPRPTITEEAVATSAPPSGEPAEEASAAEEKLAVEAVSVEEKPAEEASPSEEKPAEEAARSEEVPAVQEAAPAEKPAPTEKLSLSEEPAPARKPKQEPLVEEPVTVQEVHKSTLEPTRSRLEVPELKVETSALDDSAIATTVPATSKSEAFSFGMNTTLHVESESDISNKSEPCEPACQDLLVSESVPTKTDSGLLFDDPAEASVASSMVTDDMAEIAVHKMIKESQDEATRIQPLKPASSSSTLSQKHVPEVRHAPVEEVAEETEDPFLSPGASGEVCRLIFAQKEDSEDEEDAILTRDISARSSHVFSVMMEPIARRMSQEVMNNLRRLEDCMVEQKFHLCMPSMPPAAWEQLYQGFITKPGSVEKKAATEKISEDAKESPPPPPATEEKPATEQTSKDAKQSPPPPPAAEEKPATEQISEDAKETPPPPPAAEEKPATEQISEDATESPPPPVAEEKPPKEQPAEEAKETPPTTAESVEAKALTGVFVADEIDIETLPAPAEKASSETAERRQQVSKALAEAAAATTARDPIVSAGLKAAAAQETAAPSLGTGRPATYTCKPSVGSWYILRRRTDTLHQGGESGDVEITYMYIKRLLEREAAKQTVPEAETKPEQIEASAVSDSQEKFTQQVEAIPATEVKFRFDNLDYDKVMADSKLTELLKLQTGEALAQSLEVPLTSVDIQLSRGSVVVNAQVFCMNADAADAVKKQIDANTDSLMQSVDHCVTQIPAIREALADGKVGLGIGGLETSVTKITREADHAQGPTLSWSRKGSGESLPSADADALVSEVLATTPAASAPQASRLDLMPSVGTWTMPLPRRFRLEPEKDQVKSEEEPQKMQAEPLFRVIPLTDLPSVGTWSIPRPRRRRQHQLSEFKAPADEVSIQEEPPRPVSPQQIPSVATWSFPLPRLLQRPRKSGSLSRRERPGSGTRPRRPNSATTCESASAPPRRRRPQSGKNDKDSKGQLVVKKDSDEMLVGNESSQAAPVAEPQHAKSEEPTPDNASKAPSEESEHFSKAVMQEAKGKKATEMVNEIMSEAWNKVYHPNSEDPLAILAEAEPAPSAGSSGAVTPLSHLPSICTWSMSCSGMSASGQQLDAVSGGMSIQSIHSIESVSEPQADLTHQDLPITIDGSEAAWTNSNPSSYRRVESESGLHQASASASTQVNFKFANLDYEKVTASSELAESLKRQTKEAIAVSVQVPLSSVDVTLSKGSVLVNAQIHCPHADAAELLKKQIDSHGESLMQTIDSTVAQIPAIADAVVDGQVGLGVAGLQATVVIQEDMPHERGLSSVRSWSRTRSERSLHSVEASDLITTALDLDPAASAVASCVPVQDDAWLTVTCANDTGMMQTGLQATAVSSTAAASPSGRPPVGKRLEAEAETSEVQQAQTRAEEDLFAKFDTNNDGFISREEFAAGLRSGISVEAASTPTHTPLSHPSPFGTEDAPLQSSGMSPSFESQTAAREQHADKIAPAATLPQESSSPVASHSQDSSLKAMKLRARVALQKASSQDLKEAISRSEAGN